ncbi:hypothetical protein Q9L58_002412 [Maublancomyces gigas]|uniref:Uncharacterized protein n=1 Tax=Discina gigas TaxID=1032678 RepID=A0ABR3GRB8_9PEZI
MFGNKISPASQLTAFFSACRGHHTHIEFRPWTQDNSILVAGRNILIPKPFLIEAFISANETFTSLLARSPNPEQWSAEDARALLDSSLILLLVGAENLTAVNTRRRVLLREFDEGLRVVSVREEAKWLEGVLTSPLAKHNKSPLLWHYRRWLVEKYGLDVLEGGLEGEMKVVQKSGEVHPKNYYVRVDSWLRVVRFLKMSAEPCSVCCSMLLLQAWNYARFITTTFYSQYPRTTLEVMEFVERHAEFCLVHVSDTSCWSFLLFLFYKARECAEPSARTTLFDITKGVMYFAHDTARGHESVWVFLKTVLASGGALGERQEDLIELLEGWVNHQDGGEDKLKETELERKALEWVRKRGDGHSSVQ